MYLPCPSCHAELAEALVGAEERCPFCGTKAIPAGPRDVREAVAARGAPTPGHRATTDSARAGASPERGGGPQHPPIAMLPPGWGGLAVGSRGILHGRPVSVVGRIRYHVERPRTIAAWDAWQIAFGEGADGWLLDREGALALVRPLEPSSPIAPGSLVEGRIFRLDAGPPATVVDSGWATVQGVEGGVSLRPGARISYATLAGQSWRYHVQREGEGPMAWFRGEVIEPSLLAAGFGLRVPSDLRASLASSFSWFTEGPLAMQIALILLAIPVIAGGALLVLFRFLARWAG